MGLGIKERLASSCMIIITPAMAIGMDEQWGLYCFNHHVK